MVLTITGHHQDRHALDQGHVLLHQAGLLRTARRLEAAAGSVQAAMERYDAAGGAHPVAVTRREAAVRLLGEIRRSQTER